jgi:hypothetical protein
MGEEQSVQARVCAGALHGPPECCT